MHGSVTVAALQWGLGQLVAFALQVETKVYTVIANTFALSAADAFLCVKRQGKAIFNNLQPGTTKPTTWHDQVILY